MSGRRDPSVAAPAGELPRYRQIYDLLCARIRDGRYAIGSNLPTELELCAEFGASRYTVREALRRLVAQGMVSRRQGSGSAVVAAEPQRSFVHSVRSLADLFQYALDTHYDVRSVEPVILGPDIAASVGGVAGARWHLITGVRSTAPGGAAICYTRSYIPERLGWIVPELPGCVGPFYALLEARSGERILEAVQEIKAEPMTGPLAAALGVAPGDHALRLLRRYVSARGTLIASFNWHPADSFVYRMQLQRPPE